MERPMETSWHKAGELGRQAFTALVAAAWSRFERPAPRPWLSVSPSDELQRSMNLVMPLRSRSLLARGNLARLLIQATDTILVGLNNVGTVHFARFDLI